MDCPAQERVAQTFLSAVPQVFNLLAGRPQAIEERSAWSFERLAGRKAGGTAGWKACATKLQVLITVTTHGHA